MQPTDPLWDDKEDTIKGKFYQPLYQKHMDVFNILFLSPGSMKVYSRNRMAVFSALLAHPNQVVRDWRVALAEIIFSTSNKNVTTNDYSSDFN